MIKKVGIVGGGHMGSDIFGFLAKEDLEVVLWVRRADAAESLKTKHLGPMIRRAAKPGRRGEKAKAMLDRLTITTDLADLSDCDLISESVSEDEAVKAVVFEQLNAITKEGAIISSNSSWTLPKALAPLCKEPVNYANLHFFYPTKFVPFVEIIPHEGTSQATIDTLHEFVTGISRQPLVVSKQLIGFLVNRVITPFYYEGMHILGEGYYTASQIDGMVRGSLTVRGPIENLDQVGLEVCLSGDLRFPDQKRKGDFLSPILQAAVAAGRYGVKTDAGFYLYEDGEAKDDPSWDKFFGPDGDPGPYSEEVAVQRMWYSLLLDAYRTVELGGGSKKDIQYAIHQVLGIEEGPFDFVERKGLPAVRAELAELEKRFGPRFQLLGELLPE